MCSEMTQGSDTLLGLGIAGLGVASAMVLPGVAKFPTPGSRPPRIRVRARWKPSGVPMTAMAVKASRRFAPIRRIGHLLAEGVGKPAAMVLAPHVKM